MDEYALYRCFHRNRTISKVSVLFTSPQHSTCGSPAKACSPALHDHLKQELQNMAKQMIINSVVAAGKPRTRKLRACLNNRRVEQGYQPHYPLPTLEDITFKLVGACYSFYSIMDARSDIRADHIQQHAWAVPIPPPTFWPKMSFSGKLMRFMKVHRESQ